MGPLRAVSWGELLWDRFPDGDRLGGAAANVAHHARALGAQASLVSCVGRDERGTRALEQMRARGVDVSCVRIDDSAPTGSVQVRIVGDQPSFRMSQVAAWDRIALTPATEAVIADADVLFYGTLAQRTPLALGALSQVLQAPGPLRVCDVNLRPPHLTRSAVERCILAAQVVKMNEQEREDLAVLLQCRDVISRLFEAGQARVVAVTRGAEGAELYLPTQRLFDAGVAATAGGDAVGAGDAFTAVLGLGLARGLEPLAVLERANRYAAWVASHPGAMPEAPDFAKELFASTPVGGQP